MSIDRIEAVFEVKSVHACDPKQHAGPALRLIGDLTPAGDTGRSPEFVEPLMGNFVIIARRKDGTVPVKIGQKLRVIIDDPEGDTAVRGGGVSAD